MKTAHAFTFAAAIGIGVLPGCSKTGDGHAPPVAGSTAASPPASDAGKVVRTPAAPDGPAGGSPGPAGVQTTDASGSGATGGVTGGGRMNPPRIDPIPGKEFAPPAPGASSALPTPASKSSY